MTTITVPRETWDAMREALESSAVCIQLMSDGPSRASWGDTLDIIDAALTAANAVSDHFRGVTEMVQPLGWYCVSRDGLATQCADQRDAEVTAESANRDWPNSAPYRAVQLCEFEAHPQATEPAWRPIETAPKDGSEILLGHPDGSLAVGFWRARNPNQGWTDGDSYAMEWPTHWQPAPVAPEAKQ